MGAPRKPEAEKIKSITINLKQGTIDKISKDGIPKQIIERMIKEKYEK